VRHKIDEGKGEFPKLKNPFILAPMAGVADDVFRRLCAEQGAALVYSEMVSAKALHYGDGKSLGLLAHAPGGAPIAYQLFGSDPGIMAEAVEKLDAIERKGRGAAAAGSGDGIGVGAGKRISCVSYDVNMGCPVPKVVKNGEGSALMRDPDSAARIVESMVRATNKPVTVKIRAGFGAADAADGAAARFARAMEQAGATAIAVHGRTREQYYAGKADWGVIARAKDAVGVPVIGSGDVMGAGDACRMLEETGCDFAMVARGALGNPWIFRDAVALKNGAGPSAGRPSAHDRALMFMRHARMLEADKGEYIAVREMRRHAGWYFKGLPGVAALRAKVNTALSTDELAKLVSEAYLSK
jgi:tRNA-dihydrouridine synthase B